ncbi:MAG: FAD binding domain-containing protein, partial [Chloroflexi bacterium]|nr:FAD binding domain-containing protein [Chloroflexota bacterium]
LSSIRSEKNGLHVGAMARHQQVEVDSLVAKHAPLVHETMPNIATSQIRSRGTFGGSIAHADPSAELVAVSVALDARFRVRNQKGDRWVPANEFFVGLFTTDLEPDDLLIEAVLPAMPPCSGWSLKEVARRPHDFALMGVAALVSLDRRGRCQRAKMVFLSAGDRPMEAHEGAKILMNQSPTTELIRAAAETASTSDIDPGSDIHATAEFRQHLAKVLARRALEEAFERASNGSKRRRAK